MDLGGSGSSILISGQQGADTTFLQVPRGKGSSVISVWAASSFQVGDWIRLRQYDTDLVTSSWAEETVGQIVEIDSIVGNQIWLHSPLRMDYDTARQPYIQKLNPVKNVGIECLKIKRLDNTAPSQTSNVHFRYAVNCWVTGIESDQCTFAHVLGDRSSNLYVAGCSLHHAFGYGGGCRAYGVVFQMTTGECLAENNIF